MEYYATFDEGPDGISIWFPDIPEAHSCAEDLADALKQADGALVTALDIYVQRDQPFPPARAGEGTLIRVSTLDQLKLQLRRVMARRGLSQEDVASLVGVSQVVVSRLYSFNHRSRVDKVEDALRALDCAVVVDFEDAA